MEYEEDATQPCTQPLGAANGTSDNTSGILCVLFPTSLSARTAAARLLHTNQAFLFAQNAAAPLATNVSTVTTSDEQLEGLEPTFHLDPQSLSIALRFPPGPIDIKKGFCFGRNIQRCDIIIGDTEGPRRISNLHFRIFVNKQRVLMLEDCSTNGTYVDEIFLGPVSHSAHGKKPEKMRPQSRQLINGSQIHVLKGPKEEEIKFMVRIPKVDGNGFFGDGEDFSTFDPNNLPQVIATAGPIAYFDYTQRPEEKRNPLNRGGACPPSDQLACPPLDQLARPPSDQLACPPSDQLAAPQHWSMSWVGHHRFHCIDQIGQGAFATVQKAVRRLNGEPVAIKLIPRKTLVKTMDRSTNYKKEVEILEQLKHVSFRSDLLGYSLGSLTLSVAKYCAIL